MLKVIKVQLLKSINSQYSLVDSTLAHFHVFLFCNISNNHFASVLVLLCFKLFRWAHDPVFGFNRDVFRIRFDILFHFLDSLLHFILDLNHLQGSVGGICFCLEFNGGMS